jgi:hypothetical protein
MDTPETSAAKRAPARPASKRRREKPPYFMKPGAKGTVEVYRRPCGNRAEPKLCGAMPSRAMAQALVNQLSRAESVADDLFYEATDDGIEALEAVLEACRQAVMARGERGGQGRPPRRGPRVRPRGES